MRLSLYSEKKYFEAENFNCFLWETIKFRTQPIGLYFKPSSHFII